MCEPAAEQIIERLAEDCKDRDAQQRLPVQRPGARGPLNVGAQLVRSVTAAPDDQCRRGRRLFRPQPQPLLDPLARHWSMLMPGSGQTADLASLPWMSHTKTART
jgi:hypothetical protein